MSTLPDLFGALIGDAMNLAGMGAGAGVAGAAATGAVREFFRRRAEAAREILLDELRQGRMSEWQVASEDDALAICIRYMRASTEGAARLNLRLLAKAAVAQLQRSVLYADEFLKYADILAAISRDEIIVIATMHRFKVAAEEYRMTNPGSDPPDPWVATRNELAGTFGTQAHVEAIAGRAQRTGMVVAVSAYGGIAFRTTPIFDEIVALFDFQDVLRSEGIGQ